MGRLGIKHIILVSVLAALSCLLTGFAVYGGICGRDIIREITIEAGTKPDAQQFVSDPAGERAYFIDCAQADTSHPGTYPVIVRRGLFDYHTTLVVRDTTPPVANCVSVRIRLGETCQPEDFVTDIQDATAVNVSFKKEPVWNLAGNQGVELVLTDAGGNTADIAATLNIRGVIARRTIEAGEAIPLARTFLLRPGHRVKYVSDLNEELTRIPGVHTIGLMVDGSFCTSELNVTDHTPPVIDGVSDCTVMIEEKVDWWHDVTVTDNAEGEIVRTLDFGEAKLSAKGTFLEAGIYPLTFVATDETGNRASKTVTVTVKQPASRYTVDKVWEICDKILAQIITPDMTLEQKVHAIWAYPRPHFGWTGSFKHTNWIQGAIDCYNHKGADCFAYASITYALYQRIGVPCKMIHKIPTRVEHWWTLVDIGDGWRHNDSSQFRYGYDIYLWTTEQINWHNVNRGRHHNYNPVLYPELLTGSATKIINPSPDKDAPH